ncbi:hypothetical protein [Gluconobacter frateurii]|uniref:Uncharacterized protein n=1 Tax=Gluconobacter frateurii NRIC 0228 TaxID=1307946 RepID=A0ABQ0Q737_9PROT|nr:hypothetical protein [Gluconobacter frateurii]GBR07492.1 hypothetical protein AA0228_0021 [Gluconobacter frateurii NRIC 0228]GLP91414.1 hypothetical protein GCM10007868_24890 [Gluconobacter frateurii]
MASPRSVARNIRLFRDQALSPAAQSAYLARVAINARDTAVRRGDAPPHWTTNVDGRQGAPESSVRPDGFILYKFNVMGLAAKAALQLCKERSPVRSGRYRDSWVVVVEGKPWTDDVADVPEGKEVMIVNPQPYARKIDTGAMKMSVPPGIVEAVRQSIQRKFPTVNAARAFVTVPSGLLDNAPYILRRNGRAKDRTAGKAITYPALILTRRT